MWNAATSGDSVIFETAIGVNDATVLNVVVARKLRDGGDGKHWNWVVWSDRRPAGIAHEWFGTAATLEEGQWAAIRAAGHILPHIIAPGRDNDIRPDEVTDIDPAAAMGEPRREGRVYPFKVA
jgi:hypothetical protein